MSLLLRLVLGARGPKTAANEAHEHRRGNNSQRYARGRMPSLARTAKCHALINPHARVEFAPV